ncbi:XdhC family protein [Croceivirga thetidis]|uniref:XdhC family protein n=1 Tax=Croceivirga thetidis TaxID=2721623 RepID=A0ABX1GRS7_9FLAO|nr:XdhC/CoxI family protein [Croceivirga thetidis]NKI32309.1 XdhC family protein [Croceivirga thetidis]
MTHELKRIIQEYEEALQSGIAAVLATVVALDGSSYRRPGVRMLLLENGKMVGAVSGGCVEKEIYRQAESVFKSKIAKVMTYDGRYRLGCEGILYILLEPISMTTKALGLLQLSLAKRKPFEIKSFFEKEFSESENFGSVINFSNVSHPFNSGFKPNLKLDTFTQKLQPCFRLILIGAEHDTVQLCSMAALTGWEVTVVVHPKEEKSIQDFPGASELIANEGDNLDFDLDDETAVVLMTHSYVKDLKYLIALKDKKPAYFGLLGPARRREKLFDELMELHPELELEFIELIHGPAGLDIGAETPQEIALSVLAEIIGVVNKKEVNSLKEKEGRIHA